MSIFNNNIQRMKHTQKPVTRKPVTGTQIPLVVGLYTPNMTTELYDYVQFFYHGGGIYTAVTYVIDHKRGLRTTNGRIIDLLVEHAANTKKIKKPELETNPFDGSPVCTNVRIKTIGTFIVNDDSTLRNELVEDGHTTITYDGKPIQLIDARHSKQAEEFGQWYSPKAQFIEIHMEPNGDFVGTRVNAYINESNGKLTPTREQIARPMLETHLPNIQRQLYYEWIAPCTI